MSNISRRTYNTGISRTTAMKRGQSTTVNTNNKMVQPIHEQDKEDEQQKLNNTMGQRRNSAVINGTSSLVDFIDVPNCRKCMN